VKKGGVRFDGVSIVDVGVYTDWAREGCENKDGVVCLVWGEEGEEVWRFDLEKVRFEGGVDGFVVVDDDDDADDEEDEEVASVVKKRVLEKEEGEGEVEGKRIYCSKGRGIVIVKRKAGYIVLDVEEDEGEEEDSESDSGDEEDN